MECVECGYDLAHVQVREKPDHVDVIECPECKQWYFGPESSQIAIDELMFDIYKSLILCVLIIVFFFFLFAIWIPYFAGLIGFLVIFTCLLMHILITLQRARDAYLLEYED